MYIKLLTVTLDDPCLHELYKKMYICYWCRTAVSAKATCSLLHYCSSDLLPTSFIPYNMSLNAHAVGVLLCMLWSVWKVWQAYASLCMHMYTQVIVEVSLAFEHFTCTCTEQVCVFPYSDSFNPGTWLQSLTKSDVAMDNHLAFIWADLIPMEIFPHTHKCSNADVINSNYMYVRHSCVRTMVVHLFACKNALTAVKRNEALSHSPLLIMVLLFHAIMSCDCLAAYTHTLDLILSPPSLNLCLLLHVYL